MMTDTSANPAPVEVEPPPVPTIDWPLIQAILRRVQEALAHFLDTGVVGAVDLRGAPHMDADTYQSLKDALSTGEVTATVAAEARVEIRETQYPGVWWITHFNERGAIVTEVIEITEVPAILRCHVTDLRAGQQRLARALATPSSQ